MSIDLNSTLQRAADCIANNGVIAYPTDTVYGLGCDPFSEIAVTKLLKIKQRDRQQGLIVIAAEVQQLSVFFNNQWLDWLTQQQPSKPTTYVVPCVDSVPSWLTGQHTSLAVRITKENISSKLCRITGALVSSSANIQNQHPIQNSDEITQQFNIQPDFIIQAKVSSAIRSSLIVDAISGKILRQ